MVPNEMNFSVFSFPVQPQFLFIGCYHLAFLSSPGLLPALAHFKEVRYLGWLSSRAGDRWPPSEVLYGAVATQPTFMETWIENDTWTPHF